MIQITLNNGKTESVPPCNIPPRECEKLIHLVREGGGFIPEHLPWRAITLCAGDYAIFTFGRNSSDTALVGGVAWSQNGAVILWNLIGKQYSSLQKSETPFGRLDGFMEDFPKMPDELPMCLFWILPGAILAANPEDIEWMTLVGQRLSRTIIAMLRDGWW